MEMMKKLCRPDQALLQKCSVDPTIKNQQSCRIRPSSHSEDRFGPSYNKTQFGFTLLEVLIALFIITIAFAALIVGNSETVRHYSYIEDKSIAHWVGMNVATEARLGLLPIQRKEQQGQTTMLNKKWYWQVTTETTDNPIILKMNIRVGNKADHYNLDHIIGFIRARIS